MLSERALLTPLVFCVCRGSRRPGGMTSTYGRTPMYGSQTPMYGSGSRTPMYGSQTPLQDGERALGTGGGMTWRGLATGQSEQTSLPLSPFQAAAPHITVHRHPCMTAAALLLRVGPGTPTIPTRHPGEDRVGGRVP